LQPLSLLEQPPMAAIAPRSRAGASQTRRDIAGSVAPGETRAVAPNRQKRT
jgi:hypothetical protein